YSTNNDIFCKYLTNSPVIGFWCLKAMRFYRPKWIAIMLTILQIVQMFRDIIINISAYYCSTYYKLFRLNAMLLSISNFMRSASSVL
ncbi:hypothetical protein WN51_14286, partial [Melipona quadrifasciata]